MFRGLETFTYGMFRPASGRFDDSQESRFQATKRSNMGSAVLESGCSADIHEYCFQAARRSDMDCFEVQVSPFADSQNGISRFESFR